jgi:hypothetical protein
MERTSIRFASFAAVGIAFALLGNWYGRAAPEFLRGEELRVLVDQRLSNSYSWWHVYKITEGAYYLRSPRYDSAYSIDHRWLVPRDDIRIENGEDGSAVIGPVGLNEFVLLRYGNDGMEEVRFPN